MQITTINWSFENFEIPATFYHQENAIGLLIVFPGGGYPSLGPVLYYPTNLYLDKKFDVLSLEYNFKRINFEGDRDKFIKNLGLFIFQKIKLDFNYQKVHLIAKSIGTNIIAESYHLLEEELKNKIRKIVLLTPSWNQPPINEKLLLIGSKSFHIIGTADKLYDKKFEIQLSNNNIQFLTFPNADHGLDIVGNVDQSIEILKGLVNTIKDF